MEVSPSPDHTADLGVCSIATSQSMQTRNCTKSHCEHQPSNSVGTQISIMPWRFLPRYYDYVPRVEHKDALPWQLW